MIPIRCYSCLKIIADKWDAYESLLDKGYSEGDALDAVGLHRYCCRRMFIGHVNMIDQQLKYPMVKEKREKVLKSFQ